jgi:F-type H+/Na+-transporting ATPase subunit alpha
MRDFTYYLDKFGEVGKTQEVLHSIVYTEGLPTAKPHELILFETGQVGQVLALTKKFVEVLVFTGESVRINTRVVKTGEFLELPVGREYLGRTIDALGNTLYEDMKFTPPIETRPIEVTPSGIMTRKRINKSLETGVALVDMMLPLGLGQRELVIGDRKTGKTNFLAKTIITQARKGTICIYAAIGKKVMDVKKIEETFAENHVKDNIILMVSGSNDPTGMIYLTPYSAMSLAEYFRDEGHDVLLILDDLTTHARAYREISLLGRKFPGRNSYPGDIFYVHAKLLERGGNFVHKTKGEVSITCLPVAETTQGDLVGYIQTNIMSMTDGHLFFDNDLFGKGRRPAINAFISVTRVGRQTQNQLQREVNRELTSFLTLYEKMQSFVHFGAEINETIKHTLDTGDKITEFFNQPSNLILAANLQMFLFNMLWAGFWQSKTIDQMRQDMHNIITNYDSDTTIKAQIDTLITTSTSFNGLLGMVQKNAATYAQFTHDKQQPVAAQQSYAQR